MIIGVGTDIVEIHRIEKAVGKEGFLEKNFTEKECLYFESRKMNPEVIAGNFTVKEAASKVFGTGIRGFNLVDIEVLRDDFGKPYVVLYNKAQEIAEQLNIKSIHISISHSKEYAVGFAVGEGE